jgi:hypothetical protein
VNEDQVRAIVRSALARRLGAAPRAAVPGVARSPLVPGGSTSPGVLQPAWLTHPSHLTLALVAPDEGSPCLIEPAVGCNRCGFCQSVGH